MISLISKQSLSNKSILLSIQYLRGFSALFVVVNHVGWVKFPHGAAGVDIFFVISGFIIMSTANRSTSPLIFLKARVFRVIPLYWITTLVAALLFHESIVRVILSLLLIPNLRADGEWAPVLVQGWTLTYEAVFYMFFALSLCFENKKFLILNFILIVMIAAGACNPVIAASIGMNPLMFAEFLAGVWLCMAWNARRLPSYQVSIGLILLGFCGLAVQPDGASSPWRALLWGGPATAIVLGMLGMENTNRLPHLPSLHSLGDASYALYLTHVLVLWSLKPVLMFAPLVIAFPIAVASCVAVSMLTYYYIEQPLARIFKARSNHGLRV